MAGQPNTDTPAARSPRPRVIYVMGAGRSGSTILGVTLGNCEGIFFAGELAGWLLMNGTSFFRGSERAEFWLKVREDVDGEAAGLYGDRAFEAFERSLSLLRPDRWFARRALRGRYRRFTEALYASIAQRAGAAHVVDTSHLPMRARELRRMDGIDVYLVFLVRNIEGIVASYTGRAEAGEVARRRKVFLRTVGRLWVTYLLSVLVFLGHRRDRRLLVRHEDFIADPAGVLRELLAVAGSTADVPDLGELSTGIPLRGNKLIRTETIALRSRPEMPDRRSRAMRLADGPWQVILGRLRPAATRASASASASDVPASGPAVG